jgi:hypothetical protein
LQRETEETKEMFKELSLLSGKRQWGSEPHYRNESRETISSYFSENSISWACREPTGFFPLLHLGEGPRVMPSLCSTDERGVSSVGQPQD